MRVELAPSGVPCTDGKTVFLPIYFGIGKDNLHASSVCGKRDDDGVLICPACCSKEELYITIFHETAHIIHGSMDEVQFDAIEPAVERYFGKRVETAQKVIKQMRKPLPDGRSQTYINASQSVSPFLPLLVNALEDIRVNGRVISKRPGTTKMFLSHVVSVLRDGIETPDGKRAMWNGVPHDAQAIMGVYILALGPAKLLRYLDPEVASRMDDEELQDLCGEILRMTTAASVFNLSIKVMVRLKELGFMIEAEPEESEESEDGIGEDGESDSSGGSGESEDDESDESGEQQKSNEPGESGKSDKSDESDEQSDSDGPNGSEEDDDESGSDESDDESDGSGGSNGSEENDDESGEDSDESDDSGEPNDSDESDEDSDESDEGSGSGSGDDPTADELREIREALERFTGHEDNELHEGEDNTKPSEGELTPEEIRVAENALKQEAFDEISSNVSGVVVQRYEAGATNGTVWENHVYAQPVALDKAILAASVLEGRRTFTSNRASKFSSDLRSGPRIDPRKLGKRVPVNDDRIFGKRTSLSKKSYFVLIGLDVSGSTSEGDRIERMKAMVGMHAEMLSKLRIPFAVYAHTASSFGGAVLIGEIKSPTEPWGTSQKEALDKVWAYTANLDGHTLEFYRKVMERQRATDRLILYYTDGAMPLENYNEELAVLTREIETCKKLDIHLLGVGCNTDSPKRHGLETVRFDSLADSKKVLEALRKKVA